MSSKNGGGIVPSIYRPAGSGGGRFFNNRTTSEVAMIERLHMRRLREMCINRFTWEGLPESIDPRFVEGLLFDQALAVYIRYSSDIDTDETDMILRATPTGYMDYQDNPLAYSVYANNMFSAIYDVADCVPIWANTARTPDHDIVFWYARRLAEADRTIDINMKNARHPRVIAVSEENRLAAANINRQVDEGQPVVFISDAMDMSGFTHFDMGMDDKILSAVPVAKNQIMNDCLTALGINNANQDKVERLISGEVDARSEQVGVNRGIALNERKRAAEKINKMFGTSITVSWNEEINKELEQGGDTANGNVHDGAKESSGADD